MTCNHTRYAYYPILSTDEYGRLIGQLRAWCKASHGRQKELATRLEVSPQLVSDWLSGHRTVSLDEWTRIRPIIQSADTQFLKEPSMATPVFEPKPDRPPSVDPNQPKTLHEAKELIGELRAELASAKAPSFAAPPAKLPLALPATPPPATKPTTEGVERAKTMLANTSVDDLLAGMKTARAQGNLEAVGVLQTELESRVVTSSSNKRSDTLAFDSKDPKTWSGKIGANVFPVGCDNPKAIGEYLSTLSMDALRSHLKGAPASATEQLQQKLAFAELQNRKRSR